MSIYFAVRLYRESSNDERDGFFLGAVRSLGIDTHARTPNGKIMACANPVDLTFITVDRYDLFIVLLYLRVNALKPEIFLTSRMFPSGPEQVRTGT